MRFSLLLIMAALLTFQSGCAGTTIPGGVDDAPVPLALIYTHVQWTDKASPNEVKGATKTGNSSVTNMFGLFAFGDASVGKAAQNGGISTVHQIDHEYLNLFFIFNNYKTIVLGE